MTVLSVLLVLILTIYVAYRAKNFMGRRFGNDDKEESSFRASSEMINRTSPFNAQADFEASLELSTKSETIKEFSSIEFDLEEYTQITLLARNPYWLYTYWHIHNDTIKDFKSKYGEESWEDFFSYLKLVNLSNHKDYFLPISNYADSWYIKVGDPQSQWKVYLGKMVPEEGFVIFAESNITATPPAEPSSVIDPNWQPVEELWRKLLAKGYVTDLLAGIYSEELLKNRRDDKVD